MTSLRIGTVAAALLLLAIVVAGCSSSNRTFNPYEPGEIAQLIMPSDRDIPSHPDSLNQVGIVEKENRIKVVTESSYQEIMRKWSAASPARNYRGARLTSDYAMLWGIDPSILSLEVEMGLSELTKDRALMAVEKRKAEVRREIQIDVYWFENPKSAPTWPHDAQLRLDDGTRYLVTRREIGALEDAFLPGGRSTLYRRISYYFDREQDGNDILENTTSVELVFGTGVQGFTWNWNDLAQETDSTPMSAR